MLWTGKAGSQGVLIRGTEPPDVVELWEWVLGPGDRHRSEAHSDGTREPLQVHEGSLTVEVEAEIFALEVGDTLTFHGDDAHAYVNTTDTRTRFALTVFEPGVGASHRTETQND